MNSESDMCCVCYEQIMIKITLVCKHDLCLKCAAIMCDNNELRCPICRKDIKLYYKDIVDEIRKIIPYTEKDSKNNDDEDVEEDDDEDDDDEENKSGENDIETDENHLRY